LAQRAAFTARAGAVLEGVKYAPATELYLEAVLRCRAARSMVPEAVWRAERRVPGAWVMRSAVEMGYQARRMQALLPAGGCWSKFTRYDPMETLEWRSP
jgi:hypothetical protein